MARHRSGHIRGGELRWWFALALRQKFWRRYYGWPEPKHRAGRVRSWLRAVAVDWTRAGG